MTKIDETKQYKFSEIITMLENKELPEGAKVVSVGHDPDKSIVKSTMGGDLSLYPFLESTMPMAMFGHYFRIGWTIKLPKEDKYYLKAPGCFDVKYLNLQLSRGEYFLGSIPNEGAFQTQFTQSEIDAMPFDTNFFEKIKVEDE
ncbi:hypothetical protein [Carnobacterium divergens]|uniref:hypothetical protein n=1 Tax=Carnobacterium divergens TaxID=2748 RepID=UPI00128DDBEB|nr:hypothetical protein [Carnobacterium divergens]MPQ22195.1 hypothetical protein [Carnobacterium divergens]